MPEADQASPEFQVFEAPSAEGIGLPIPPRLASWDARDHPDQVRLREYLDAVETLLPPQKLNRLPHPLAMNLTVGLAEPLPLLSGGRDLDNYLNPLVRRLGPGRFVSVWASKGRGSSAILVDSARNAPPPRREGATVSARTALVKEAVADAVRGRPLIPDGAVELQIAIVDGGFSWQELWKPLIDGLGQVLGVENPNRPFTPRDDRIVRIGIHRCFDEAMTGRVRAQLWWRSAAEAPPAAGGPAQKLPQHKVLVREAVEALGGSARMRDVLDWLISHYRGLNRGSLAADINMYTVNSPSRVFYPGNDKPRPANRPDIDFLFRPDRGQVELYDPARHGLWAIARSRDGGLEVTQSAGEGSQS